MSTHEFVKDLSQGDFKGRQVCGPKFVGVLSSYSFALTANHAHQMGILSSKNEEGQSVQERIDEALSIGQSSNRD